MFSKRFIFIGILNFIETECGTDDDLRVEVEPSSTMDRICGYECNASLSCAHGCSQDLINATCLFNATWSSTPNCVCTGIIFRHVCYA